MTIGLIIWGLVLLGITGFVLAGVSLAELKPQGAEIATFGLGLLIFCAFGWCLAPLLSLVGTILGVVALTQNGGATVAAWVGLALNGVVVGLWLLGFAMVLIGGLL